MRKTVLLFIAGLLVLTQAKPQPGYSYPQPTQPQLPVNLPQPSYQQPLVNIPQSPQIQVSLPQATYSQRLPELPQTSQLQVGLPQPAYPQQLPQLPQASQLQVGLPQPAYPQQLPQLPQASQLQVGLPQPAYPQRLPEQQISLSQTQQSQSTSEYYNPGTLVSQIPSSQQTALAGQTATTLLPANQFIAPPQISQPALNTEVLTQTQESASSLRPTPQIPHQFLQILPQSDSHLVNLQTLQLVQPNLQQIQQQVPLSPSPPVVTTLLPQAPLITKHVYVHVAPDEPPLPSEVLPAVSAPRKTYKILFIKAPSLAPQRQVIHVPGPQAVTEEKTLVYVLVDKPQLQQIVVPAAATAQSSKPEVYFIKYKAKKPAVTSEGTVSSVTTATERPISSGESSSSLFSGGLKDKYGPPGYQKRSV